ncbi:hypothetical protein LOAG_19093, partial [Loa loa]
ERTQRNHISPRSVEAREPSEQEIVLVNEPEIPRGMWKLAKIKEIKRGNATWKTINRPVNMLYPLEVDDNETIQQPTPEIPIQNSEPEEPIATRTRRATRKRDGTRPIFMSITNCLFLISLIFITTKIEKDTTCNFSKPYLMNGDIIIDEGVDKWQTKNAMNSDSKDQLIMKEINDEENKS